jgi:sugar phosphate isomerase/epimerase
MYVTIRDAMVQATGFTRLDEGLKFYGLKGVEMHVEHDYGVNPLSPTPDQPRLYLNRDADVNTLSKQAHDLGVRISAFLIPNDFNSPNIEKELDWMVGIVEAASRLGAPAVRIDAIMSGERDLPLEQRQDLVAGRIKQVLDRTAHSKVDLGIENHGFQGNDPAFLDGLISRVHSPRLGLTMDIGNFYWAGHPLSRVYEILEHFAKLAKHTHIKNINYPAEMRETKRSLGYEYGKYVCPIPDGDIDLAKVVGFLKRAGYKRDLCIEDESLGKFDEPVRRAHVKAAIAALQALI